VDRTGERRCRSCGGGSGLVAARRRRRGSGLSPGRFFEGHAVTIGQSRRGRERVLALARIGAAGGELQEIAKPLLFGFCETV